MLPAALGSLPPAAPFLPAAAGEGPAPSGTGRARDGSHRCKRSSTPPRGTRERQRGRGYKRFTAEPFCTAVAIGRKEIQRPRVFGGVFASFCRRGQKDVAPERETSLPLEEKRTGRRGRPPLRRDRRECAGIRRCADAGRRGRRPLRRVRPSGCGQAPETARDIKHIWTHTKKGRASRPALLAQNSGASGDLRYRRGLPSASTSTVMPPE